MKPKTMREALEHIIRRLQMDIDDGSRPDHWSMQDLVRVANDALAHEQNPWRQAVDEALIAHALDCTGPGDDPKKKVKELIEWAVTIATDPRVSETAAREQEASATGSEPAGFLAYQGAVSVFYPSMVVLTDETKRWHPPVSRIVPLYATPTTSTTGKVDASRVRDEALEEAAQLYGEGEVAAPGGHSQWGDAHQEGWIDGTKAYRDAIRSLIGAAKSEGEANG